MGSGIDQLQRAIEAAIAPRQFPIKVVAIDGHGGSGKSTLATHLAEALEAEVLHTDDFASWEHPLDWAPRLIEVALEPIKAGATSLSYQRSSWGPSHRPDPVLNQPVTPVMILEGVSSTRREFRPYLTYAIWVETPRDLCLQRGLERDGQQALAQWQEWLASEDAYIARDKPGEYVDVIVSGTEPFAAASDV